MAEKCRVFLCPDGQPALTRKSGRNCWMSWAKTTPLFVRDGDRARQLQSMSFAAPQRVLTVLLLAAWMNDFTEEKYESVLACWHLMDRDLAAKDYTQPQELARTGEILYTDGLERMRLKATARRSGCWKAARRVMTGPVNRSFWRSCTTGSE